MADVVLKDRNGTETTYPDVETVELPTSDGGTQIFTQGEAVENVPITLDLADGDQTVTAGDGVLVKSAVIQKPDTLVAENIRSGVEVAGVVGNLIGDTEETTVDLAMADGDQVIEPSSEGKVLSKVTVTKPDTLTSENIRYGESIAGVEGSFIGDTEEVTVELDFAAPLVETDILPEMTLDGFEYSETYMSYIATNSTYYALTIGEAYTVCWDGVEYECVGQDASSVGFGGATVLGNASAWGFSGNDEPFVLVCWNEVGVTNGYMALTDTEAGGEHTISIYQMTKSVVEEDVLPLTTYTDFAMNTTYGVYAVDKYVPYTLTIGESYFVVWDGETYECVCQDASAVIPGGVVLGNGVNWGLLGNNEPFAIATLNQGGAITGSIADTEAGGTHTIRIYQETESTASDMVITPSAETKVLSKVTITKPDGAEQVIARGEELGGISGEYVTPGTTKEIEPNFSDGNHIETADGDERWNEVVVAKPEALLPENIVKGIKICGVEGSYEGGESSLGDGAYNVKVIDYDGTVLAEENLDEGDVFTLPDAPEHEGLVFDGWSSPIAITDNTVIVPKGDLTIGPMYHTASGATEIDIALTKGTGLTFTFVSSSLTGMTSIDWGDGTTDSTLTHTYSDYGEYTIKIYGMTEIADGSQGGGIVSASTSSFDGVVIAVRCSSSVTSIGNYAFYCCASLTNIVISSSVTSIRCCAFYCCSSLTSVVIPSSVTSILWGMCYDCYSLTSVVIPSSVTSFNGNQTFYDCRSLTSVVIPSSVTDFNGYNCFYSAGVRSIIFPPVLNTAANTICSNCHSLKNVVIPSGVTAIGSKWFYYCSGLTSLVLPSTVTTIADNAFCKCLSLRKYDFTACTSVPTLSATSAFASINESCQILVPSSLYSTWIAATNWSTYANYIVAV